jgi:hypothetical protein
MTDSTRDSDLAIALSLTLSLFVPCCAPVLHVADSSGCDPIGPIVIARIDKPALRDWPTTQGVDWCL